MYSITCECTPHIGSLMAQPPRLHSKEGGEGTFQNSAKAANAKVMPKDSLKAGLASIKERTLLCFTRFCR
jgi:hypothetical protein